MFIIIIIIIATFKAYGISQARDWIQATAATYAIAVAASGTLTRCAQARDQTCTSVATRATASDS